VVDPHHLNKSDKDREINYIDLKRAAKKNLKVSSPNINTVRYGLSQSQR
jgi:hypothetical protein